MKEREETVVEAPVEEVLTEAMEITIVEEVVRVIVVAVIITRRDMGIKAKVGMDIRLLQSTIHPLHTK